MSRTGLSDLRTRLRSLSEAGTVDYTVNGSYYWTDDQLDEVLDRHRTDLIYSALIAVPYQAAGSLTYNEYRATHGNLEQTTGGTAIFYVQDESGNTVASSSYSPDYNRGVITFAANQEGSAFYLNARSFDLTACAAEIWRTKAAHYFTAVDFSTDNHRINRSQIRDHCLEMAEFFEARSPDGAASVSLFRGDTDV